MLEKYRPARRTTDAYTLHDHNQLAIPAIRELFTAFQKEVLALDPCVTEEVTKLYIAYKAETNFVDVVPQTKRLRVVLNMRFPDIVDPKQFCFDMTQTRHWGNGDVELFLTDTDELPYVMGLVRQSLELQLGNDD